VKGGESVAKKVAKTATKRTSIGAGGGLIFGVGDTALKSTLNPDDYKDKSLLKQVMLETAIGGVADPLIYGGGQVLKAASNKTMKNLLPSDKDLGKKFSDILLTGTKSDLPTSKPLYGSLPDRLKALNPERKLPDFSNAKPVIESPNDNIIAKHFGVDAPAPKNDLLQTATPEYWRKRYEDFADHVKKNYDMNQMTKEGLDDLWSQFAKYDEPVKLDELAELAYKDYKPNKVLDSKEVWDKLGNRPSVSKNTLNKLGLLDVKSNKNKSLLEAITPLKTNPKFEQVERRNLLEDLTSIKPKKSLNLEQLLPNPIGSKQIDEMVRMMLDPTKKETASSLAEKSDNLLPLLPKKQDLKDVDFRDLKDISGFHAATTDIYRVMKKALADKYDQVGKPIMDHFDMAKKKHTETQENWLTKLKTEIVDELGIKKGTKESALVQDFGEKTLAKKYLEKRGLNPDTISPEELNEVNLQQLKTLYPDKWEKIVKADQWFRHAYDELIDRANMSRAFAFPNDSSKLIPKRKDYYRHFREMEGLTGLKNIFDSPSQIDPHLAGLSQHTNPNSKWHGFMQKRGLGKYKSDAVGGFLDYLPEASYATHIDPTIPMFKELRKGIADSTVDTKNANNFVEFLYNFSNDLAGKTNPYFDRNLQQLIGRKGMKFLNWTNGRTKTNTILGNASSALAQLSNVPQGIAFAKQHSVKGVANTLTSIVNKKAPIRQSPFIKERYIDGLYQKFDHKFLQQPKKLAVWFINSIDRVGTSVVWNSVYEKGIKEGVKNPIKYADHETRRLIAGRGVGEVPLLQKSKAVQLIMPFTLEVANAWKVMGEFVKSKDFGGLATLFIANYALNEFMEETRGSGVTFDPIGATIDAFKEKGSSAVEKVGRLAGEVLSNTPLGQHLASLYPEYGEIAGFKGPTREELFGNSNPQRFGTSLLAAESVSDPLFKVLTPFGGNQLKKTLNGWEALRDKGEYKKKSLINLPLLGEKSQLKYPVNKNLENVTKGLLFGPGSTKDARDYYDNKRKPLTELQTKAYQRMEKEGLGKELYDYLRISNTTPYEKGKITKIEKDPDLSNAEKIEKIRELLN
ncbi:hypothetical protein BLX88_26045, partial [Bacillus obstructivus]